VPFVDAYDPPVHLPPVPPAPTVIMLFAPAVTAKLAAVKRPPAPPPPAPVSPLPVAPPPPPPAITRYSTVAGGPDKGLNVAVTKPPNKLLMFFPQNVIVPENI
jgi:deleted-in-malignant-brain-tumors protein 1